MYEVIFYTDKNGNSEVRDYILKLSRETSKDSRIKSNKINDYIQVLQVHGKKAGEPYIKHIEGEIWEIRPLRDRIFFATWSEESFIILHYFMKKTQKTPAREIEQAKRNLSDYVERRR
jgi:phage-related protein